MQKKRSKIGALLFVAERILVGAGIDHFVGNVLDALTDTLPRLGR